jgi:hypothetical protein
MILSAGENTPNEPALAAYEGQEESAHFLTSPLLSDEQRRIELEKELQRLVNEARIIAPPLSEWPRLVDAQFECELKLEEALRADGFTEESILSCRADWRRSAFSPESRNKLLSPRALREALKHTDIRKTACYQRIIKKTKLGCIHLKRVSSR